MTSTTILFPGYSKPFSLLQIMFFVASGPYSIMHLANGSQVTITLHLRKLQGRLPDYLRVHRSYLVNPDFIDRYRVRASQLLLATGQSLPVSKPNRSLFVRPRLNPSPVVNLTTNAYHPSQRDAAQVLGVHPALLTPVLAGRASHVRHNRFRYATDAERAVGNVLHS
ncbi:hypothetical protein GO755_29780 [Spirosoma sp. HMF4905]|uniref:HTH LytTR-type domain-containing protein n=1 Tax=Spirosoma arboris TaxID=2682092 RepID=A0A7K1SKH8_9BACT|nr:LytTR family DNA-binding domain-containing protein [Spirosoma arboris]MVM34258.1 hypothetical protein [Spirosoma arboris]